MIRPLAAAGLAAAAALAGAPSSPAQEPTPLSHVGPSELLVCAPGYPGTPKQAQAIMDELAKQITRRALWQPGRLTARYVPTEVEGLEAIKQRPAWLLTTTEFYCKHVKAIDGEVIAATQLKGGASERFALMLPADTPSNDLFSILKGRTLWGTRLLDPQFVERVGLIDLLPIRSLCDVQRQQRTLRAVKEATRAPATSALWLSDAERELLATPAQQAKLEGWSVVRETDPIPSAPVIALHDRRVSGAAPARLDAFKQALYSLNSTDEGKALCAQMRMRGFITPDTAKYDAAVQRYHPEQKTTKQTDDGAKDD